MMKMKMLMMMIILTSILNIELNLKKYTKNDGLQSLENFPVKLLRKAFIKKNLPGLLWGGVLLEGIGKGCVSELPEAF